ncbi:carbonic anhydrase [Streptomyces sp. NPDC060334]|uniref:carbonic anhydrase n=1 Tax=unclassified Streptomyces TaxID=2593676 RepID=UPI00366231B5
MRTLIDNARTFHRQAAENAGEFARLAAGQAPQALFITCSDSRVIPSLITGAGPGELFEMRTAGNIVPPYRLQHPSGEAATIEYAVEVLGVADIVVCGHSHCGAVGALVRGDDLTAVPAVQGWLNQADSPSLRQGRGTGEIPAADLAGPVQRHVLEQMERLRGYPGIARRLAEGQLRLHGWFYEIHTGLVCEHRPQDGAFLPL